jgi:hypothetical protein
MRYKDGDLRLVSADGVGNLQRREDEASRRVQDQVQWDFGIGHVDRPQHLFGVVDVDVAHDRKPEELHRLLTVHEQDDAGVSHPLQLRDFSHSHGVEQALPDDRLKRRQHKKDPEDVEHGHEILLFARQMVSERAKPGMPRSASRGHWPRWVGRNGPARMKPATKPPTWAHQATLPPARGVSRSAAAPTI